MLLNANQKTDDPEAQALAAIRSVLEPQHVVLFGSTGPVAPIRRTHSAQADLDLLIIAPSPFPPWADSPSHLVGRAHREGQFIASIKPKLGGVNWRIWMIPKMW